MTIHLKTPEEIEKMREAGRLAAEVLQVVAPHVKPGVTTEELDRICHEHIVNVQQATPANVGYRGYPKATCISVNNVVCHGIPNEAKVLKDGDILNIDRSEEHTSELQSLMRISYAVFCLKKQTKT